MVDPIVSTHFFSKMSYNSVIHKRRLVDRKQLNTRYLPPYERASIEDLLLTAVDSFYCDITTLICDYVKQSLRIGTMLDIFDESMIWRTGYVIALRDDYVGVHYNNYGCMYDDWIHFDSLRLAPFHTHSLRNTIFVADGKLTVEQYKWCQDIYHELLQSEAHFNCPTWLWTEIVKQSNNHCKANFLDSTTIKDRLKNFEQPLVRHQHNSILQCTGDPSSYPLTINGYRFNRELLENYLRKQMA